MSAMNECMSVGPTNIRKYVNCFDEFFKLTKLEAG